MGDGDFGFSLARGFEIVLAEFDSFDRTDVGTFLKKIGVTITSRIGGTSGPIWGTAFMRAGASAAGKTELTNDDVIEMLRAAIEGIKARGQSDVGDKTLLDSLQPAVDSLEAELSGGASGRAALTTGGRDRAEGGRGHEGDDRETWASCLHGRTEHRERRCRGGRRRGDVRTARRGVA